MNCKHMTCHQCPDPSRALREEVERLREVVRQVHALAEVLLPVWPESRFGGPIREIHKITKGMVNNG